MKFASDLKLHQAAHDLTIEYLRRKYNPPTRTGGVPVPVNSGVSYDYRAIMANQYREHYWAFVQLLEQE